MEKQRILWLDYAKLIGLYFVILGHVEMSTGFLAAWIYSFHMPLFFIISGFTEKKNETFSMMIKKGARTLLVPYFCFYLVTYVWWLFIFYMKNGQFHLMTASDFLIKPMIGLIIADASPGSFFTMINIPLWFLVGLFFCKMFFHLGMKKIGFYNKSISLIVLNVLAFLFVFIFSQFDYNILFSIDVAIMAIPFYSLGYVLSKVYKDFANKKVIIVLTLLILLTLNFFLSSVNGNVDMATFKYGNNLYLFYVTGMIGAMGILVFCHLFSAVKNKFALLLASNTLIMLAIHGSLTSIVKQLYGFIRGYNNPEDMLFSYFDAIIIAIMVLLLSIIPILVIQKYFPFMIGKKIDPNKVMR